MKDIPIFPAPASCRDEIVPDPDGGGAGSLRTYTPSTPGMTLRQWYAGMAMQALLSVQLYQDEGDEVIAKWAFSQADAMLAQEEK